MKIFAFNLKCIDVCIDQFFIISGAMDIPLPLEKLSLKSIDEGLSLKIAE